MGHNSSARRIVAALVVVLTASLAACAASSAKPPPDSATPLPTVIPRTVSPEIGAIISAAQDKAQAADFQGARLELDRALTTPGISASDTAAVLRIRGGVLQVLDDPEGALADWDQAVASGGLTGDEIVEVLYDTGQLALTQGHHAIAVERLESWLNLGGQATDETHLNIAAAYNQLEDLQAALPHAELAFELADPPQARHYRALLYLYTELEMIEERAALIERAGAAGIDLSGD